MILIAAGALIFLSNLGWLDWEALLGVSYLWPLLLVAFGLDMLLRGRHRLVLLLGTVVAAALLYGGTAPALGIGGPAPEPESIAQRLAGARRAEVTLSTGVTALTVRSDARSDLLAEGTVQALRGERIERSFSVDGGVARFALDSEGRVRTWSFVGDRVSRWDLTLSGLVPLDLRVDTGVGEADLDLSQLRLERLALNTGVGASTVTLPASGRYSATIETGVGAVTIRIPRDVPARIRVSRGVGGISVPAAYERQGDVYVSPDYSATGDGVELSVDTGVGAVSVVLID